jgi:hypothetical protein
MSDLNEVFADAKQEGDTDPFAALETETPAESQPEQEPEAVPEPAPAAQPVEDDENSPFHIRWKQREQNLREELELSFQTRLEQTLEERLAPLQHQNTEVVVPEWFQELYGDNVSAYLKYEEYHGGERERIKQEAIEELSRQQQEAVAETEHWNNWVESGFASLEATGKTFNRRELTQFMLDNPITDIEGNFDFQKSYALFERLNAAPVNTAHSAARKQIAAATTRTVQGERTTKDYMTPNDLRNVSWNSL